MGVTWTSWALPGLLTMAAAWTAAAVLLRTAPSRSLNRRLAWLLFLEGLWMGGMFFFLVEDRGLYSTFMPVAVATMATLPFQYLAFLSIALRTPLLAPFRSRTAFWLLAVGSAGAAAWVLVSPSTFIGELYSPHWATWNFRFTEAGGRLAQAHGVASLLGLVAALDAYRRSSAGSAARSRAFWFAVAFGLRDAYAAVSQLLYPVVRDIPFWGEFIYNPGQGTAYLLYVLLMAYGVLRTQLFDIDLKLKFALRQSTVGALLTGTFFTLEYSLQQLLAGEDVILGLAISAGIVLALRPVQRVARSFADRVMSGVRDTSEYVRARKGVVYRAALEGAIEDGEVTERERAVLDRLRGELEMSVDRAERLEREMTAAEG